MRVGGGGEVREQKDGANGGEREEGEEQETRARVGGK